MLRIVKHFYIHILCITMILTPLAALNLDSLEAMLAEPSPESSMFGEFGGFGGMDFGGIIGMDGGMQDMFGSFFGTSNQAPSDKKEPLDEKKELEEEKKMSQEELFLSERKIKQNSGSRKEAFDFYIGKIITQLKRLASRIESLEFGVTFQDEILTNEAIVMPATVIELLERVRSQDAYVSVFFQKSSDEVRKRILNVINILIKINTKMDAHEEKNTYDIDSVSAKKSKPKQRNRILKMLKKELPELKKGLELVLGDKDAGKVLSDLKKKSDDAAKVARERQKSRSGYGYGSFGSYGGGYNDFGGYSGFGSFGGFGGDSYFDEGFGGGSQWGGFGDYSGSFWSDSNNFGSGSSSFGSASRLSSPKDSSNSPGIISSGVFKKKKKGIDAFDDFFNDPDVFKKRLSRMGVTPQAPLKKILEHNPGKTLEQIFEEKILEEEEVGAYLEKINRTYAQQEDYSQRHAEIEKKLSEKDFRNTIITIISWISDGSLKRKESFTIEQVDAAFPIFISGAKHMTMPLSKMQYDVKIKEMVEKELSLDKEADPEKLEEKRTKAIKSSHQHYLDREQGRIRTKQHLNSLLKKISLHDSERYDIAKELLKTFEADELSKIEDILNKYIPTLPKDEGDDTEALTETDSTTESAPGKTTEVPPHIEMIDIQKLALHTAQTLTQPTSHGFISFHEGKKAADKELSHHLKVLETVQNKVIDLAEPHALNMKELQSFIEEAIAQTKATPEAPLSLQEAVNKLMASDKYKDNKNIQSRADELAVLTPEDVRKWSTETALIFRIGIAWQINDTLKNGTGDGTTVPLQEKVIANLGHDFSGQKGTATASAQATEESREDATVESLQRHSTQKKHKTLKAKREPMALPDMGNLGSLQALLDNLSPEEAEKVSSIMKDPQAMAGIMQQAQGMLPAMMPGAAPGLPTRK